jgi:hypothetical protein
LCSFDEFKLRDSKRKGIKVSELNLEKRDAFNEGFVKNS